MITATVKSITSGCKGELFLEVEQTYDDLVATSTKQFRPGQRVVVTAIPDDTALIREYKRGLSDGKQQAEWAVEKAVQNAFHEE